MNLFFRRNRTNDFLLWIPDLVTKLPPSLTSTTVRSLNCPKRALSPCGAQRGAKAKTMSSLKLGIEAALVKAAHSSTNRMTCTCVEEGSWSTQPVFQREYTDPLDEGRLGGKTIHGFHTCGGVKFEFSLCSRRGCKYPSRRSIHSKR